MVSKLIYLNFGSQSDLGMLYNRRHKMYNTYPETRDFNQSNQINCLIISHFITT